MKKEGKSDPDGPNVWNSHGNSSTWTFPDLVGRFRNLSRFSQVLISCVALVGVVAVAAIKTDFYPRWGFVEKSQASTDAGAYPVTGSLDIDTYDGHIFATVHEQSLSYTTTTSTTQSCTSYTDPNSKTTSQTCVPVTTSTTTNDPLWMAVTNLTLEDQNGNALTRDAGSSTAWLTTYTSATTDSISCDTIPKGQFVTARAHVAYPPSASPFFGATEGQDVEVSWTSDGQCDSTKGIRFTPDTGVLH